MFDKIGCGDFGPFFTVSGIFFHPHRQAYQRKAQNPFRCFLLEENTTGITWLRSCISLSTGWRSHITVWDDWKNGTILFHISTPGPSINHDYVLDKPVFYCPTFLSLIIELTYRHLKRQNQHLMSLLNLTVLSFR